MREKWNSLRMETGFLSTRLPRAWYIGWGDTSNIGDAAVLKAIRNLFRGRLFLYEKQYQGRGLKAFFDRGNVFDGIILGGGTLIKKSRDIFPRFSKAPGKKRYVLGSGVANPDFWVSYANLHPSDDLPHWIEALNRDVPSLSVRGPHSQLILERFGYKGAVRVVGDPALYLAPSELDQGVKKSGTVGINVGFTHDILWGQSDREFLRRFEKELKTILASGWNLKLFSIWPPDRAVVDELAGRLGKRKSSIQVVHPETHEEFDEELKNVDYFIGEKLHSVIFSTSRLIPSIMIEYRPKCRDYMASIGMDDYVVRSDDTTQGKISGLFEALVSNEGLVRKKIRSAIENYRKKLEAEADFILRDIKDHP